MGEPIAIFENRVDEPFRQFKDGCVGALRTIDACGDKYIMELKTVVANERTNERTNYDLCDSGCQVIGDIYADNNYGSAGGRVYGIKGVAPAIGASHFQQVKYILVKANGL